MFSFPRITQPTRVMPHRLIATPVSRYVMQPARAEGQSGVVSPLRVRLGWNHAVNHLVSARIKEYFIVSDVKRAFYEIALQTNIPLVTVVDGRPYKWRCGQFPLIRVLTHTPSICVGRIEKVLPVLL